MSGKKRTSGVVKSIETIEDAIKKFESFLKDGDMIDEDDANRMNELFKEHDIDVQVASF